MARRYSRWPRYVPVAERRRAAAKMAKSEAKKGNKLLPISISGRAIATTFWGKAWCQHLEKFSDYANRLPRGRTYARNGSVIHLEIDTGKITAMVSGTSTYHINITIKPLPRKKWNALKSQCAGGIDSVLELLQGKLSNSIMQTMCDRDNGLFPSPKEISLDCDCPDWAALCKHLAAVMYGIGARLDESPELLFQLRGVDYQELIGAELAIDTSSTDTELGGDLDSIFGIELDTTPEIGSSPNNNTIPTSKHPAPKRHKKTQVKKSPAKPHSGSHSGINISRGIRASHIIKLRKFHKITQQELAKITGKSTTTIRNWESRTGVLKLQSDNQNILENIFAKTSKQIDQAIKRNSS
ncbi:hypothetical protein AB833_26660 [Chromatiales bacterium (ex Bugula neritina AB1)]|nr:hypothetical protein AB833_26660 [Chromatiales bacterium (ex Bugula neritina AB1)]